MSSPGSWIWQCIRSKERSALAGLGSSPTCSLVSVAESLGGNRDSVVWVALDAVLCRVGVKRSGRRFILYLYED